MALRVLPRGDGTASATSAGRAPSCGDRSVDGPVSWMWLNTFVLKCVLCALICVKRGGGAHNSALMDAYAHTWVHGNTRVHVWTCMHVHATHGDTGTHRKHAHVCTHGRAHHTWDTKEHRTHMYTHACIHQTKERVDMLNTCTLHICGMHTIHITHGNTQGHGTQNKHAHIRTGMHTHDTHASTEQHM